MGGKRNFSEAEREIALQIIFKQYGGEVTVACGNKIREKLGRHVSDVSLRNWKNESLRPKRSHHKRVENGVSLAPQSAQFDTTDASDTELSQAKAQAAERIAAMTNEERDDLLLNLLNQRALDPAELNTLSIRDVLRAIDAIHARKLDREKVDAVLHPEARAPFEIILRTHDGYVIPDPLAARRVRLLSPTLGP